MEKQICNKLYRQRSKKYEKNTTDMRQASIK